MPESDRIKFLRRRGLINDYKTTDGSQSAPTVLALLKIYPCLEYAEAFRQGKLYFRPLEHFRKWEEPNASGDEDERADRFEGSVFYGNNIKLTVGGYTLGGMTEPPAVALNDVLYRHTFCMYAINSGSWGEFPEDQFDAFRESLRLHERVEKLGGYAVVVTNGNKFLRRVDRAMLRLRGCPAEI